MGNRHDFFVPLGVGVAELLAAPAPKRRKRKEWQVIAHTKAQLLDAAEAVLAQMAALKQEGPPTPAHMETARRLEAGLGQILRELQHSWLPDQLDQGERLRALSLLALMQQVSGVGPGPPTGPPRDRAS